MRATNRPTRRTGGKRGGRLPRKARRALAALAVVVLAALAVQPVASAVSGGAQDGAPAAEGQAAGGSGFASSASSDGADAAAAESAGDAGAQSADEQDVAAAADEGASTPVVTADDPVCKVVDDVDGVQTFGTVAAAVSYIGGVGDFAAAFPSGRAKVELLQPETELSARLDIVLGTGKPLSICTAAADADDGYSYRGAAGTQATLKRASSFTNSSMLCIGPGRLAKQADAADVVLDGVVLDGAGVAVSSSGDGVFGKASAVVVSPYSAFAMENRAKIVSCVARENTDGTVALLSSEDGSAADPRVTFTMSGGSEISSCKGSNTTCGIFSENKNSSICIDSSTISGNEGATSAIKTYGDATLKGTAQVVDNMCTDQILGAIYVTGTLYLQDNATVRGNTQTVDDADLPYSACIQATYTHLSGAPVVYDNLCNGAQHNLTDPTDPAVKDGDDDEIVIDGDGLDAGACVGIYRAWDGEDATYLDFGTHPTFARTAVADAADAEGLAAAFVNDLDRQRNAKAKGDSSNEVVWGDDVCKREPADGSAPTYYSSVAAAFSAVQDGDTITIFRDNEDNPAAAETLSVDIAGKDIIVRNEVAGGADWRAGAAAGATTKLGANRTGWDFHGAGSVRIDGCVLDAQAMTSSAPVLGVNYEAATAAGTTILELAGDVCVKGHAAGPAVGMGYAASRVNMSGGEISGCAAGIVSYAASGNVVDISGGAIKNNTGVAGGPQGGVCAWDARTGAYGETMEKCYIWGNPYIYGNRSSDGARRDVALNGSDVICVGEYMAAGSLVGVYSEDAYEAGDRFATSMKEAAAVEGLAGSFVNDRNEGISCVADDVAGSHAVLWDGGKVCRIVRAAGSSYYKSLDLALADVAAGETIDIMRSHTVEADMTISVANVTIRNIIDPAAKSEDPAFNASADAQPVVTFAAAAQLKVQAAGAVLQGVVFDGKNAERTKSAVLVGAAGSLSTIDGAPGTHVDGTQLAATSTVFRDFYNTATTDTSTGGGFALVDGGTLVIEGGSVTGCRAKASQFNGGGGAVALVLNDGTLKLDGGTFDSNGIGTDTSQWGDATVLLRSGTFDMESGTVSNNKVRTGGCVSVPDTCTATIRLAGGVITKNTSMNQGGAVYVGPTSNTTCTIAGDVQITENKAANGSVVCCYATTTKVVIEGSPKIENNTGTSNGQTGAAIEGSSNSSGPQISVSGSPVIYGNKNSSNAAADLNPGALARLSVAGDLGAGAKIGYYSSDTSLTGADKQFASTVAASASSVARLSAFVNDVNSAVGAMAGTGSAVVWKTANVKVVNDTAGVQVFETIAAAVTYLSGVSDYSTAFASHDGVGTIEVLVNELTQTEQVSIALGASKPVALTTAKTADAGCTDGYPYRGDTSKEEGRAVVKRGFNNTATSQDKTGTYSMFAVKSSSVFTLSNCIVDGNSDNSYYGSCGAGVNVNSGCSFTMEGGATIRNSAEGYSSGKLGAWDGGGVYVGGASGSTTAFSMKSGSSIEGCSGRRGAGIFTEPNSTTTIDGATIKDCCKTGANNQYGAAIFPQGAVTLLGETCITGNKASSGGSAITLSKTSASLTVKGKTRITGNTYTSSGTSVAAIDFFDGAQNSSTLTVEESIYIYDNLDSGGAQRNCCQGENGSGSKILVGSAGFTSDAKVGVYALTNYNSDNTFATTSAASASGVANLSAFVNDKNTDLRGVAGTGSAVKWTAIVVKETTAAGAFVAYYDGLANAIAGGASGDNLEILKSHSLTAVVSTNGKSFTIKNITNPANDLEDWTKNGNNTAPVVTFTSAGRLTIDANTSMQGVCFDGGGAAATKVTRTTSAVYVQAGKTLTVDTGLPVDESAGRTLHTDTKFTNFINYMAAANGTDTGGAFNIAGSATLNDVTVSGCISSSADGKTGGWAGGGAVAYVAGTLTINRGTYTQNGNSPTTNLGGHWSNSPFTVVKGSLYATGATFTNNSGNCGGVFVTPAGQSGGLISITGGKIADNYASYAGGAIFLGECNPGSTCKIGGDTEITGNSTGGYTTVDNAEKNEGAAIYVRGSSVLELSGTVNIHGNNVTGRYASATAVFIDGTYTGSGGCVKFTGGSPTIYDNKNGANQANLGSYDGVANVQVTGALQPGTKVGYRTGNASMDGPGEQFATASTTPASSTAGIAGAFINDANASLLSTPNTSTNAIQWVSAVVKETLGSDGAGAGVACYDSLNEAATKVTEGNSLEILKTHALKATLSDGTSGNASFAHSCTVRNVLNPANASENPFVDASGNPAYSDAAEPVVYFGNANTADGSMQLTVPANVTVDLKGVKFSGHYYDGTNAAASTARAKAGISVAANGTLTVDDGSAGALPGGVERSACATVVENFVNTSTALATSGGVMYVAGNATVKAGTLRNNVCYSSGGNDMPGGGSVASISAGGVLEFEGGTMTGNGTSNASHYAGCAIACQGGAFNMTGGLATGNRGSHGGFAGAYAAGSTIHISGGEVCNNTCTYDGAAIFVLWFNGNTATVDGTALIDNNRAGRWNGAISGRGSASYGTGSIVIKGSARIVNNTSGVARNSGGCAVGSPNDQNPTITISENPVIYGNKDSANAAANLGVGLAANLKVGVMGKGALVGYSDKLTGSGAQFATSTQASAASSGYLAAFVNDVTNSAAGFPLRGTAGANTAIVWGASDPAVKLTEKVDVRAADGTTSQSFLVHTFGGDDSLGDAVACAAALPAANMPTYATATGVDGDITRYYKMEVLVAELSQKASVIVQTDDDKPLMLTTADPAATDGYRYRGDTTKENGRAVVKRAWSGDEMFKMPDSGFTTLALSNIVVDGDKATYPSTTADARLRGFWMGGGNELVLDSGTLVRNMASGSNTTGAQSGAAALVYNTTKGTWSTFAMRNGASIEGCSAAAHGGAVAAFAVAESSGVSVILDGSSISGCSVGASNYGGAVYALASGAPSSVEVKLSRSGVSDCSAKVGGAVSASATGVGSRVSVDLDAATVSDCHADADSGGAIYSLANASQAEAQVSLANASMLSDCSAKWGGAIYARAGAANATGRLSFEGGSCATGCSARYGAGVYVRGSVAGAVQTFSMDASSISGCTATTASGTSYGGGLFAETYDSGTQVTLANGSRIEGCSASEGGAVYGSSTMGGAVLMRDSSILGCSAATYGGAVSSRSLSMEGTSTITGCSAQSGYAAVRAYNDAVVSLKDSAKIEYNSAGASTSNSTPAVALVSDTAGSQPAGHVEVSGSARVYDNSNSTAAQANLGESTAVGDGAKIVVGSDGLNSDAQIGVWSDANEKAGASYTFARTATTPSTGYENLSAFVNDRLSGYRGVAGEDDRVIWEGKAVLVLKKTIPAAALQDAWFTVELKNTATNEVYRQSILVPAGSTSGEARVVLEAATPYTVADVAEQSAWRYTQDTADYTAAAGSADVWDDTTEDVIGTVTLLTATVDAPGTLTLATKEASGAAAQYVSSTAGVVNTLDMG